MTTLVLVVKLVVWSESLGKDQSRVMAEEEKEEEEEDELRSHDNSFHIFAVTAVSLGGMPELRRRGLSSRGRSSDNQEATVSGISDSAEDVS